MMKNLRVPIKIATKKDEVGGIEFKKFRKFAILQNERMNKHQDTRPLKPQAYIKLEKLFGACKFQGSGEKCAR